MSKLKAFTVTIHVPRGVDLDQPSHVTQCQAAVIATSALKAAAALDVATSWLRTYGGPGIDLDRASGDLRALTPDTLYVKPLNSIIATWTKVER